MYKYSGNKHQHKQFNLNQSRRINIPPLSPIRCGIYYKKIIRHQIPTTTKKKDIWDCVQLVSYLSISYNLSAMEFILFLIIAVIIFLICALCKSGKRKPMFSGEFSLLLISHEMHLGFANHLLIQWFIKFSFHTKFIQNINACIFQFSFVYLSIGWWCKEIRPLLYCIHGK